MAYGNRGPWKGIFASPLVLVIVCVLIVLLARASWGMYERASASDARLRQAQANVAALEAQQEALSKKVSYLSTSDGVQAELREKYRAIEPGESVAVIVDASTSKSSPLAASSTEPVQSWWEKVLSFFGL